MRKKYEKKISDAIHYQSLADGMLEELYKMFKFKGFEYEPVLSMCGGSEIIIVYRSHELHINRAIDIMEAKGYIEPQDIYYQFEY